MRQTFMRKHPRILVLPTQLKLLKSDSHGIKSKFLYHEIQHHLLIRKTYLGHEKYAQEKI